MNTGGGEYKSVWKVDAQVVELRLQPLLFNLVAVEFGKKRGSENVCAFISVNAR